MTEYFCQTCGWRFVVFTAVYRSQCPRCHTLIHIGDNTDLSADCRPPNIAYEDWPRWAKLIAKRRKPEDIGVGSTVRRIAERRGGERFKRIAEWLGIPCGCTTREERWNRLYPYDVLPPET